MSGALPYFASRNALEQSEKGLDVTLR